MSDVAWLRELHDELWGTAKDQQFKLRATRALSQAEWARIVQVVQEDKLIVEMICTSMFGGVGIRLYEHPPYPGVPVEGSILLLTEDHLPWPTREDRLMDRAEARPKKTPGACSRYAWEAFSAFTHTEQNKGWLKAYGLEAPREAEHYDY